MKIWSDDAGMHIRETETEEQLNLNWYEVSQLGLYMRRGALWFEVAVRWDEHKQWSEIEEAKDDILDELDYRMQDDSAVADAVYDAVTRWVDIEDDGEDGEV
jgi:hypothetical protein